MIPKILRYPDLKSAGIVGNRATLYRWIRDHGFPRGLLIGPNSRGWPEDEVLDWLENRRASEQGPRIRLLRPMEPPHGGEAA